MISKARVYVILYAVLLGAHVALVWCVPYFPTQDGPSHVYNSVILHDLLHGKGNWANFYSANVQVFPNLGFPMLAYPLLSVLQPLAVERAFITAYVLLLGVAVPVFLRAMGSAAWPLSFFLFVVIFNKMLLMGFYSNAIGVPALLLAVALAWRIRHRPIAVRALWLNVAGAVLLLIHLIPFALFLLGVAVMVAVDANDWKESVRRVIVTGGVMLPSVLFAVSLIIPNMCPSIPSTWSSSLGELVRGLVIFSGESYSRWQLLPGVLALLVVAAAGIEAGRQFRRERKQRDAVDSSSPFLATFCGLLMIVYFSAPDDFLGGALFKMRLPWVILLLALPLLEPATRASWSRTFAGLSLAAAALAFAVNAGVLWRESKEVAQFDCAEQAGLPAGAKLLAVRFDVQKGQPDPLMHAASFYGLRGAVDLANYEAGGPFFLVQFREDVSEPELIDPYDDPQGTDWSRFPQVEYLLAWKTEEDDGVRLEKDFTLFWERADCPLSIWKRRRGLTASRAIGKSGP